MYDSDSDIDSDIENLLYSRLHYSAEINLDSDSELKVEVDNSLIEAEEALESIQTAKEKEVTIKDDNWAINEKDRQGAAEYLRSFSKAKRYYIDQRESGAQCHNCSNRGHLSRDCPEPKKETCHLCGSAGHVRWNCPNDLCYNCYEIGHIAKACKAPRKSYYTVCKRCWGRGHHKNSCPEIWRQYHLTIKENGSLKEAKIGKNGEILTMRRIRYCYNCGYEGHFGHDCTEERPNRRPVNAPFVVHYDKCPFKAKSRNENNERRKGADALPEGRSRSEKNKSDRLGQADSSSGTRKENTQERAGKKKKERVRKKEPSKDKIPDPNISLDIGRYSRTKIHEESIIDISSPDDGLSEDEKVVEGQRDVLEVLGNIWQDRSVAESKQTADAKRRTVISVEQKSNEKGKFIQERSSAEKVNSSDKQGKSGRQNLAEKQSSTDRQSSGEKLNSTDKQSSSEKRNVTGKRNSAEKQSSAEVRKSNEKRNAVKKKTPNVIAVSSDTGEDDSKATKEVVRIKRNKAAVDKSDHAQNAENIDVDNRKRKWRTSAGEINENSGRKAAKRSEVTKELEIIGNKDVGKSFHVVSSNENIVEYVDIDVYASNSDMEQEIDENDKKIDEKNNKTTSDRGKRKASTEAVDTATSSGRTGSKKQKVEKQQKQVEESIARARDQTLKESDMRRKEKRPSEKPVKESGLEVVKDANDRNKKWKKLAAENSPERPNNNNANSMEMRRKIAVEKTPKNSKSKSDDGLIDSSHFMDKSRSKVDRNSRNVSKKNLKEKRDIGNPTGNILGSGLNDDFISVGNYDAQVPRIIGGSRFYSKEVIRGNRGGMDSVEGDGSHVVFVDEESESSDDGENFQFSNLLMNQDSPVSSDQEFGNYNDNDNDDDDDDDDDLRKTIDTLKASRHDRKPSNQRSLDQIYVDDYDARDFLSLTAKRETADDDANTENYPRKVDLTRYDPNVSNEEDVINYGLRKPANPRTSPPNPERRPTNPKRRLASPIRKSPSNPERQPPNLERQLPIRDRQYADDLDHKIVTIRRSTDAKRQPTSPERRSAMLKKQLFDPEGPPVNPERRSLILDRQTADNSDHAEIDGGRFFNDLETRSGNIDTEKAEDKNGFYRRIMNDLGRLQIRRSFAEEQTTSTPTLQTQSSNVSTSRNIGEKRSSMDQIGEKMSHDMVDLHGVEIKMAQWIQDKIQDLTRKKRNSFKALLKKRLRQHGEAECPRSQADLERLILKWKREVSPATKREARARKKAAKNNRRKVNGFASRQSSKSKYSAKGAGRGRRQSKEERVVNRSVRGFRSSRVADDFMLGGFV